MLFNSFEFWLFFAIVFGSYLLLPRRAQNVLLLLASYLFYAAWDWRFLSLLCLSTAVDFILGRRISEVESRSQRRRLLGLSLAVNLGLLGFFKYAGFFADSFSELALAFGIDAHPLVLEVVLPVGISFYTFQTLSYTLDIYRGRLKPTRDLLDFALFVAFFPQLVAGPIERAANLLPQIAAPRRVDWERVNSGGWLALWGLFKKVVIADNLALLVDTVYARGAEPTGPEVLFATYAFAFQIYCDFSGYTDIARGISRMLGFDLMQNFNLPYLARSPADFWARWHISLSTWLHDYLFIPTSRALMKRTSPKRGAAAGMVGLFITMVLCGLWHGAAWTFVLFGAYHGVLLVVHRYLRGALPQWRFKSSVAAGAWRVCKVVVTFHLVVAGYVLFRAESVSQAMALYSVVLTSFDPGLVGAWLLPFVALVGPLIAMQALEASSRKLADVTRWPFVFRTAIYAIVMFLVVVQGEDGGDPFIYFQF